MRIDRELPAVEVLEGGRLKRTEFNYSFDEADDNAAVCQGAYGLAPQKCNLKQGKCSGSDMQCLCSGWSSTIN